MDVIALKLCAIQGACSNYRVNKVMTVKCLSLFL